LTEKSSLSICTQLQSDCLHNTPQHIHCDENFPENFNAQGRSHRR